MTAFNLQAFTRCQRISRKRALDVCNDQLFQLDFEQDTMNAFGAVHYSFSLASSVCSQLEHRPLFYDGSELEHGPLFDDTHTLGVCSIETGRE